MTAAAIVAFCYGVAFACALAAAAFFLRFWQASRDPLFVWFSGAFALLGVHWAALVVANPYAETRPYLYLLRLLAFVLIIIATLQKNRAGSSE
jgi:hypothetical protein